MDFSAKISYESGDSVIYQKSKKVHTKYREFRDNFRARTENFLSSFVFE